MSAIVTPGPQQNKPKLLDQVRDVTRKAGNTLLASMEIVIPPIFM
jgi:hypothetical protein